MLKETHLYAMKNFIVAENRMKYKTTNAKYKIIFIGTTRLTEIFDDSFQWHVYSFKPYEELKSVESVDETHLTGNYIETSTFEVFYALIFSLFMYQKIIFLMLFLYCR